jgi:hypothetical protein
VVTWLRRHPLSENQRVVTRSGLRVLQRKHLMVDLFERFFDRFVDLLSFLDADPSARK